MKNWNLIFALSILLIVCYELNSRTMSKMQKIEDRLLLIEGKNNAIFSKIQANEKESIDFYKMQKNLEVWNGTGCVSCHNSIELALPITKISINEAIKIVRDGTEKSRSAGMPLYSARGTRDKNSITDSELKVRFDLLYTQEFLTYTKEKTNNE